LKVSAVSFVTLVSFFDKSLESVNVTFKILITCLRFSRHMSMILRIGIKNCYWLELTSRSIISTILDSLSSRWDFRKHVSYFCLVSSFSWQSWWNLKSTKLRRFSTTIRLYIKRHKITHLSNRILIWRYIVSLIPKFRSIHLLTLFSNTFQISYSWCWWFLSLT